MYPGTNDVETDAFAIIEEEPIEGFSEHESLYYSAESGSLSSQEQGQEKKRETENRPTTVRSEESGFDDRKERKRRSLGGTHKTDVCRGKRRS